MTSVYCLRKKINLELGVIKQKNKGLIQNTIPDFTSSKDFYKSLDEKIRNKTRSNSVKMAEGLQNRRIRMGEDLLQTF